MEGEWQYGEHTLKVSRQSIWLGNYIFPLKWHSAISCVRNGQVRTSGRSWSFTLYYDSTDGLDQLLHCDND